MKKEGIIEVALSKPQQPQPFNIRSEKARKPHLCISRVDQARQRNNGTPNMSLRNKLFSWSYSQPFTHRYDFSAGLGSSYHRSAHWQPEMRQAETQCCRWELPRAPAPSDPPRRPLFPSQEQLFSCFLLEI